ncbi:FAD/NAD-linked reductase, dimerization domain [Pseudocohnilembus persalinus]|uniref:FAD/NAD-linked reductase, dimerization domain n=1 Tax=Pseudocohnilembus persalinus TaxID=266149 RepID=A0A0V0R921_PSEPJ|nr:FAD/NAD-linked reductase, dimerization domain [Pseudocohnilembus persalinus]|eukprot:KRX10974.1 FAD/NAD-linked reductase, dimerization domain [Pseudocohnilembus persalinus]
MALNLKGLKFGNIIDKHKIDPNIANKKYDLAIVGGGSGGIACAYEAKKLGLNTILFDYVDPSTQGSTWGLGGTCVNVGCIPKKLFHNAALLNEQMELAKGYGINYENQTFAWEMLINQVQQYIKSNNFGYKSELIKRQIPYVNAFASFKTDKNLVFSSKKEEVIQFLKDPQNYENKDYLGQIEFENCIIATGGRPSLLPDNICKNMEKYAITSDDLFSLKKNPGKTLVVGGGYIALECAGALKGIGNDVTVMTRGLYLRSMDRQITDQIVEHMEKIKQVKIIPTSLPHSIEKLENGQLKVQWKNQENNEIQGEDVFDTVISAVGRNPNIKSLNLDHIGVKLDKNSKKIIGNYDKQLEKTSVDGIYALGDVLHGVPELTPVAQKIGVNLARKIAKNKHQDSKIKIYNINYDESVPTTVFTPLEYGFVGLSEEQAIQKYGQEKVEIYLSLKNKLESNLSIKEDPITGDIQKEKTFFKLICLRDEQETVIGIHYLGANAGEVIQGLSVAFKMGLKKQDLDQTIGIHPTIAEEFVGLNITKASGESYEKTSC